MVVIRIKERHPVRVISFSLVLGNYLMTTLNLVIWTRPGSKTSHSGSKSPILQTSKTIFLSEQYPLTVK